MKTTSFVATIMAAMAVSASPVAKRELGGVLMCVGANATGVCDYSVWSMEECHQLPAPFHGNINTFAPDGEGFACFPRTYDCGEICTSPTGCTFGEVDFQYEHKYNMSAITWESIFKSFDCHIKKN
ncbi:hypothetical protein F5X68DRAFT_231766 [Plectosphaerella plurivora]|uniref:Uncharacterized protein n=1 Tax=Plectosphaerella plurivora TaxID=936078 RepID=A0A9P8VB44_9PEZI|nr:hypothetical protein F5X68DRAFT_231766 [Plectosphaerella plurivora]